MKRVVIKLGSSVVADGDGELRMQELARVCDLLARLLRGLLFGVTADDPITFLAMLAALTLVAAIAGYIPALRASRIDPAVALRSN